MTSAPGKNHHDVPTSADRGPPTTDGTIALANLHTLISGLAAGQSRFCVGGGLNCLPRCHWIARDPTSPDEAAASGDCRRER